MEGSMDVLPFSLSCDRCDFRTKSMSAMRHHAQTHPSEHQDQQPIEEIGINNHAPTDDHALQALVDSALNDASRLLLSSPNNHHHHHHHLHQDPSAASNRSSVEEVGRTDGDGHQDRKTERMVTPRASALAAEDLLGIYAAGIDFSVVGGGVVEDNHFRAGCSQEVPTMTSATIGENMDTCVRSGIAIPSHDEAACRMIHPGADVGGHSRSVTDGRETAQFLPDCSGNPMEADSNRTANPKQNNQINEVSCGIDPKQTEKATNSSLLSESSSTSCSKNRISGETQLLRCKKATRPVFQFVIHRSAFSKTSSADDDIPSSSSKHGHVRSMAKAEAAECHTFSASNNTLAKDADSDSIAMTSLRTRGHRTKPVLADEGITTQDSASGKRCGRKLACPLKVILSKRRAPSKRGRRVSRSPGRPRKDGWKKMRYICPECSFSCMYKKDLTAHTKLVHAKNARKNARVGKVRFEINNSKTLQSLSEKSRQGSRRTSRKNSLDPYNQDEEDVTSKPKRLSRNLNKERKAISRVSRKPTKDRNPVKIEPDVEEENESTRNMDDDWVPAAVDCLADMSSSEGEANASGKEGASDDGVCNICHKFIAGCRADMKRHKAEMHSESSKQFRCNYCDYSCQFRKTLTTHIHDLHGNAVQLLTAKTTEPKMKPKKKEVDTSRVYRCNICNFSCHSSHLLNSHMKSAHHFEKMSGEFTCNVCGKVIVGRYSHFRRHLRCHSDERPFKCDQCPLAFRDSNSLNCHMPIHKEDRDYLCEDCGMAFKRPINLRMHRKVHSDKMFPCDECDYKCRRRNTLLNHKKRKHLKQKTVLCQHCGHRFFSKTECKNHVLKKHTQRPTPFACPICPAVFMFQYRFKAHVKTHPEIKPYKCHFCGFETRLNTYLMDHMRQHTGEKPKKCNQCDYETSTNSNLYKHRKRHHGPGIPRLGSRTRKPRLTKNKDENPMGVSEEQKQRAEKSVVEDIVNAVEFSQIASQVNLAAGSQAAAAMFNMATMCSTQEFKQEHLMQVPPTDVHQGLPLLPDEVNIISSVSDTGHDADRLSISILDKTTSSVAAMMEALADARNMRPPQLQATHQPNHQTIISYPSAYPIHLATAATAQSTTHPNTTSSALSSAPVFPRSVAAMAANMTMHYVHPNIGAIGPGGGNYHHLSALAGEAATRSPITSHGQPTPHNVTIPPPLLGVGQGQNMPQPLTHFTNMMHY